MNNKSGVYCILNKLNKHIYIGSTVNFKKRWREHRASLNRGAHKNSHLQHAWNKYGETKFKFLIVAYCQDITDLIHMEQALLDMHYGKKSCYNICSIAGSSIGVKITDETKTKMSAAKKGRKMSEQEKLKRSIASKLYYSQNPHPMLGRQHSIESKIKMSHSRVGNINGRGNAGRIFSAEQIVNMSKAQKQRHSPDKPAPQP